MPARVRDKEDIIKLFCELSSKVGKEVFNSQYASDCFCKDSLDRPSGWAGGFRYESEYIFDFIRRAVNRAISDHKDNEAREAIAQGVGVKHEQGGTSEPVIKGSKRDEYLPKT